MNDLKSIFLQESYEEWRGRWVHYSTKPHISLNPQAYHNDPIGIYLFPETFNPVTMWKTMPYKFIVSINSNAHVLDLSSLSVEDCVKMADDMGVVFSIDHKDVSFEEYYNQKKKYYRGPTDLLWSQMKEKFTGKTSEWNKKFRQLGYDAIFDDVKSIHSSEVQLIVLNPKIMKVVDMNVNKGVGYEDVKRVFDRIVHMFDDIDGYLYTKEPRIDKAYSVYKKLSAYIRFSNFPDEQRDNDAYRSISFSIEAEHKINPLSDHLPHNVHVSVYSQPKKSYGIGATYDSTNPNDWKQVDDLKEEIEWVLENPDKYVSESWKHRRRT